MEAAEIFAKNADKRRQALGLTHEKLADRLGIKRSVATKYLSGKTTPGIDLLLDWCKALETSPNHLLGFDVNPPKPRKPTPLEIALHLFDQGAPDVDPRAVEIIKRALEANADELAVMHGNLDGIFDDESVDDSESGAG